MPANRVAALAAALTAIVGALVSLLGAIPETWQGPVLIAALVCITAVVITYLLGHQRWDKLIFDPEPVTDRTTPPAPTPLPPVGEPDIPPPA